MTRVLGAEWTRLELATSGVTDQRSNQLSYHSISVMGDTWFEQVTLCL